MQTRSADPIPRNEHQPHRRSGEDPLADRGTVRSAVYGGPTTAEQIRAECNKCEIGLSHINTGGV